MPGPKPSVLPLDEGAVAEGGGIEPLGLFTTTLVFGTSYRPFSGTFRRLLAEGRWIEHPLRLA